MTGSRRKNIIIIAAFLLAITAPLLVMTLKLDPLPHLDENRKRAEFPTIRCDLEVLRKLPDTFNDYFNDNFGLRDDFISLNFLLRFKVLGVSPSGKVIIGRDNWLFYAGDNSIEDFRGITHYDDETLRRWATALESKKKWLEAQGIRYLFVVAPNKETIYGEHLPSYFRPVRRKTGLDEFIDYMKGHTGVEVVDVRQALINAKKDERIYSKTSTHWNDYGAFIAYREIMKPVRGWFPTTRIDLLADFDIERKTGSARDLAIMIGGSEFIKEEMIVLTPRNPRKSNKVEINASSFAMGQTSRSLPRALVFRDSFFIAVVPFLSEQFQFSKYYWQRWDQNTPIKEMIKKTRPDIVIEEVVERFIKYDKSHFTGKDF